MARKFNAIIKKKNPRRKRVLFVSNPVLILFLKLSPVLAIILAGGYFLLLSDNFLIKKVDIEGVDEELKAGIEEYYKSTASNRKFYILNQDNIFMFPASSFVSGIMTAIPNIKNIEVEANYPDTLSISAQEREQKGIWCELYEEGATGDCFFYDTEGVIYREASRVSRGSLIVAVRDGRTSYGALPQKVLSRDFIDALEDFVAILEVGYAKPIYIALINNTEMRVGFGAGWEAYFSYPKGMEFVSEDARLQYFVERVENLMVVLDEEIGTRAQDLEYIDLRLGNKVFYRYRASDIDE